ncbi:unnamed protein product [Paramecium sonneborni]|uniref:Uncharacterized protein n=1 Tax=Paramecium sonneborni TaxID=65129 RepID=A0A8S1QTQ5_9CILI|nr:unnamed protein product [Paramecium sonneborni]
MGRIGKKQKNMLVQEVEHKLGLMLRNFSIDLRKNLINNLMGLRVQKLSKFLRIKCFINILKENQFKKNRKTTLQWV